MRRSPSRHARVRECLAHIVGAEILLKSHSSDQRAAARDEITRARDLMLETGALIYAPTIDALAADGNSHAAPALSNR
jgi:hypothetical protein